MRMRLSSNWFRPAALIVIGGLLVLLAPNPLLAYGGGGGGDSDGGQSPTFQPLTAQQIETIFSRVGNVKGFSTQTVETMVKVFRGKKIDPRQLYRIRQQLLETKQWQANNWASFVGGCTTLVETADTVGSYTQVALSFVPGVGWVTTAALSVARSGADAYKQGGDAGQIVKAMTIDGATSVIMKGSPLGNKGTKSLQKAGWAYQRSQSVVSKTLKNALVKSGNQNLAKGLVLKTVDHYTGKGVNAGLTAGTNAVQNSAPSPTYQSRSSGFGPHFAR